MNKLKILVLAIVAAAGMKAQDSTALLNHEIGFNVVNFLRQVTVFKPENVNQLPYDVFYNIYYKDKIGLRFGLGLLSDYSETQLDKQEYPKEVTNTNSAWRLGVSYNFVKTGIVTFNGFADFVRNRSELTTVQSVTMHVFPNPTITEYTKVSTVTTGSGFQVGLGVKCKLYKQLSLYAELPYVFINQLSVNETFTARTGEDDETSQNQAKNFSHRILLPATVYLVLRF